MTNIPKIVIVGAGFGGIELAKAFRNKPVDVLLIDENNYHNFQPLMYQVATGGLEPGSIAYPVRRIFRKYNNVAFRMAEVQEVDTLHSQLLTSIGNIAFDFLVIATGSQNNFFNFEPVKDKLLTLKSIPDALDIRSFILQNLEKVLTDREDESFEEIINVAIVGGGPAGLELAGALAEMKKYVLPKDFPELDLSKMNINLYEAGPELLETMSEEASLKSLKYIQEMGVNVFLNTKVSDYDGETVTLGDGTTFLTDTVIWSAGVKGSPLKGLPNSAMVGGNRISIDVYHQVQDTQNIFAVGDVASHITKNEPKGLPMLASVAQQQGRHLAKNLLRSISKKPMKPFKYNDKGTMATIGRNKAVVDLPHFKFQGAFAWFVWMFFHIFSLVGFRNKMVTFFDWFANYVSYDRPLGLIIRPFKRK